MKNVIVIGASGSLASVVIEELEKQDDVNLTLFLRNRGRLHKQYSSDVAIIEGDVMDYLKLKEALEGQDIVYINLVGNLEAMTRNIVKAMKECNVNRVIGISSIGIYNIPLTSNLIPYRKLADTLEESGLDCTVIRPDWFTYGNEVDYHITRKGEPEVGGALSRKSIATFISEIIKNPELYKNENLGISKLN